VDLDYRLQITHGHTFWHQSTDHAWLYRQFRSIFIHAQTLSTLYAESYFLHYPIFISAKIWGVPLGV